MPPAIEFRDLQVRTAQGRLLLDRVSLALQQGTVTSILGRSGSGKTTLMRTVNRMIEASAGTVLVNGHDVRHTGLIALRRGIGYVIQETGLFPISPSSATWAWSSKPKAARPRNARDAAANCSPPWASKPVMTRTSLRGDIPISSPV